MTTTDGFIVSPADFPGENFGSSRYVRYGNDLSMGAKPITYLLRICNRGRIPIEKLDRITKAMAETAYEVGVSISGDTKVARGQVDGVFIATTGVGEILEGVNPLVQC